jgi:RND family efflux transporter MFP subunit
MKIIKRPLFWIVLVILLLVAMVGQRLIARSKAQQAAAAPVATVLELSPNELVTLGTHDLKQVLEANGSLSAVNQASVKAKVAGEVKEVLVREGDSVKLGQLIARIDPIEYDFKVKQARGNVMSAQGQLDIARRSLTNNKALLEQGFISSTALENAQGQYNTAEANVAANQAALELAQKSMNDTQVRAPMNGVIAARNAEPGEKVSVDGKLLDIVDLSALELEAAVPAADIALVQIGQEVAITPEGFTAPVLGHITRVNPATQAGSRSYLVYAKLDQPEAKLRSGLFAKAAITVTQKNQVLAVPLSALRSSPDSTEPSQSTAQLYAIEAGRLVQKKVQTGFRSSDDWIEIVSGLAPGTPVVRVNLGQLNEGPVQIKGAAAGSDAGSNASTNSKAGS